MPMASEAAEPVYEGMVLMTASITDLPTITTLPLSPEKLLEAAKDKLTDVLILGWDKEGNFYAASSDADMARNLYLASKFAHKIHADYTPLDDWQ